MIGRLETKRLILRPFELSDIDRMSKINASTTVMRYFPEPYSIERTVNFIEGIISKYQKNQPAVHACVCKKTNELMGSVGVTYQDFEAYFTPCYEIGWRLDNQYWHQGYATAAARAILAYFFNVLNFNEIVSYTPVQNEASIRVMQAIGMQHTGEYFNHTLLDKAHPLSKHILYRLSLSEYQIKSTTSRKMMHSTMTVK